jgi:hypothetical protein
MQDEVKRRSSAKKYWCTSQDACGGRVKNKDYEYYRTPFDAKADEDRSIE